MRGEYVQALYIFTCQVGSPPLARGIRVKHVHFDRYIGITPACAGNTRLTFLGGMFYRDHPRLRGEYPIVLLSKASIQGSPPLARGIPNKFTPPNVRNGITPACAGNTLRDFIFMSLSWDHPRLRGEYTKKNPIFTAFSQSLPLNFI